MALQPLVRPWLLFQFHNNFIQMVGLLGRGISTSQGRYLHTEQHKQNERTHTSMPPMGFEPTTPVFERAKTFHAIYHAAAAMDTINKHHLYICYHLF
jgi:hypothetical protein